MRISHWIPNYSYLPIMAKTDYFIPNTVSHVILQYFAATCWDSKMCPFRIDWKYQTTHANKFWNFYFLNFENYAEYWIFCGISQNLIFPDRKLLLNGFRVPKCPCTISESKKPMGYTAIQLFACFAFYSIPFDSSKARPCWIGLDYETTNFHASFDPKLRPLFSPRFPGLTSGPFNIYRDRKKNNRRMKLAERCHK